MARRLSLRTSLATSILGIHDERISNRQRSTSEISKKLHRSKTAAAHEVLTSSLERDTDSWVLRRRCIKGRNTWEDSAFYRHEILPRRQLASHILADGLPRRPGARRILRAFGCPARTILAQRHVVQTCINPLRHILTTCIGKIRPKDGWTCRMGCAEG